jgi:hypothetical protein
MMGIIKMAMVAMRTAKRNAREDVTTTNLAPTILVMGQRACAKTCRILKTHVVTETFVLAPIVAKATDLVVGPL